MDLIMKVVLYSKLTELCNIQNIDWSNMKIFQFKIIVSLVYILVLHGINLHLTGGKPGLCNKLCFFYKKVYQHILF